MRKITFIGRLGLLLLAAAALAGPAQAQVSAYVFAASAGTFMPLPATATSVPALRVDDATSGPTLLSLDFSFGFNGVAYTGVKACANGFLSFNPNATYNVGNSLAGTAAASEKPCWPRSEMICRAMPAPRAPPTSPPARLLTGCSSSNG